MRKVYGVALGMLLAGLLALQPAMAGEQVTGRKLRVGSMANSLGLPLEVARRKGYFKDAGLNIETIVFATGAPINEAMAADELDIAVSGMASVYALATGRYAFIGEGIITLGGEAVYARPDSDIVKVKGKVEGTLGDAATLKDVTILGPLATSSHYAAIRYIESVGLTADDFQMVSMERPQAYQAFVVGEGDLIATSEMYTMQLERGGYVKVCDLSQVAGSDLTEPIFVQNDLVKECRGDLAAFLECYYKASEDLKRDHDLWRETGMSWYAEEGRNYSPEDMETELKQKDYHTLDTLVTERYPFGATMLGMGEFFTKLGMIDPDNTPNIAASIDTSIVEELKAKRGK